MILLSIDNRVFKSDRTCSENPASTSPLDGLKDAGLLVIRAIINCGGYRLLYAI